MENVIRLVKKINDMKSGNIDFMHILTFVISTFQTMFMCTLKLLCMEHIDISIVILEKGVILMC